MELIGLCMFLLICYGAVRMLATIASMLGEGGRFRAYKQLARRYGGRYESRGLSDPPTVSFTHRGFSVRVGLAPLLPGQPNEPRTRFVGRFPQGLPFRMELTPHTRNGPMQPPRGTRPVKLGAPEFDRLYLVQANDAEMAHAFLSVPHVPISLERLRALARPASLLLSVNPERLLLQVDRNIASTPAALDQLVQYGLMFLETMQASVLGRVRDGVAIVPVEPDHHLETPECRVCGTTIESDHVACTQCNTPFHQDCWAFVGGCSTYGCTSRHCRAVKTVP